MSVQEFNMHFDVKVVRFETYPREEPHCYVVGFSVEHKTNGRSMYVDCQVAFDHSELVGDYSADDIKRIGWDKVKESVYGWSKSVMTVSPVVNRIIVPTVL